MPSRSSKKLRRLDAAIRAAGRLSCTPELLRREVKSIATISRNSQLPDFHARISCRRGISKEAQHMARESVGPSNKRFQQAIRAKHAALQEKHTLEVEQRRLEQETLKDALTGIFNRRFFDLEVQKNASRAERSGEGYAIIMIDADKFKNVNDTYGHQAGDAVLIELATRVQEQARAEDYPCRYGGEEFAVILPDCATIEDAVIVAERMRRAIEGWPFILPDGQQIKVTASFGVAFCNDPAKENAAAVIKKADMAVYAAKGKDIEGLPLSDEDKANARNRVAYIDARGMLVLQPRTEAEPDCPADTLTGSNPSGATFG